MNIPGFKIKIIRGVSRRSAEQPQDAPIEKPGLVGEFLELADTRLMLFIKAACS